jgi:hypothetical protein
LISVKLNEGIYFLNIISLVISSSLFSFSPYSKDDGMLRTMNTEKSLKTLPVLHQQLEALIQFDVLPNELTNGVINGCFILLSKDLIRLFACYNDGIINILGIFTKSCLFCCCCCIYCLILEKYFDMNKKNCKEALDIYKKFLDSTDRVSAFLKVAEVSCC